MTTMNTATSPANIRIMGFRGGSLFPAMRSTVHFPSALMARPLPLSKVFQRLEKFFAGFPMIGKNFPLFSNDWKKFFQWLENSGRFFQ